jgi:hypothetical protein
MIRIALAAVVLLVCASFAPADPAALPVRPPEGAVVLFDGTDLSHWVHRDGRAGDWRLVDGAIEARGGDILTRDAFQDFDLHVEFLLPDMPNARGQAKANSGVYLQGLYEIQVLDSFGIDPLQPGDCGGIYAQKPADVNACRPPGQWQSYDIQFTAARFDSAGVKTSPARVTVVFNGQTIHKDVQVKDPTPGGLGDNETPRPGPVLLQDHGNPVRYRNIWLVPRQAQATPATVLFDGSGVAGWHQAGPGSFELLDGALVSHGGMGLFWHELDLGDFELSLEFRVSDRANNSGVFVRFPAPGNDPWVAVREGHEIQICDAQQGNQTGAIYDKKDSTQANTRQAGEWNTMRIRVVGQHYSVTVNDVIVNEYTADRSLRGRIGIQNHDDGSRVAFRNIKVVDLGGSPATRPAALQPVDAGPLEPGLVGEYFSPARELGDIAGKTPFLVRVEPHIDFDGANGEFYGTKLGADFVARWSGFIRVPVEGEYQFATRCDDKAKLYIHNQLVVDDTGPPPVDDVVTGTIALAAGDHPIRIEFWQGPGGAAFDLDWKRPGDAKLDETPPDALLHAQGAEARMAWDRSAWQAHRFDRLAWVRQYGPLYEKMDYGRFISATIEAPDGNVTPKGIAIRLGSEPEQAAVLFDTELLRYSAGWTDGYLNLDGVAFSGAHGPNPSVRGDIMFATRPAPGWARPGSDDMADPRAGGWGPLPREWAKYKGLYRHGDQVVLSYSVGDCDVLEVPGVASTPDGRPLITRTIEVGPSAERLVLRVADSFRPGAQGVELVNAPPGVRVESAGSVTVVSIPPHAQSQVLQLRMGLGAMKVTSEPSAIVPSQLCTAGPARWQGEIVTQGRLGEPKDGFGYVVDTLTVPETNPWDSWFRFGGIDFFADGTRAAVCTWSGDVWIISGIDDSLSNLRWKRFAAGLFQPLGLRIVNDTVYVLGRDQITRLHDLNGDGEADFYECFNNDCIVSPSFHEFALDLQSDPQGNFYYAKGGPVRPGGRGWQTITPHNGTVLKVSPDGQTMEVLATGVRAPNGMGAGPEGQITVADNEGTWTPACRLSLIEKGDFLGVVDLSKRDTPPADYDPPICWFPHPDVDNSSGGQVWVTSDRWGPFTGDMLHMSYGKCTLMKVMWERVDGIEQGGVIVFPMKFDTGICRGRFNPRDGQLYLTGLRGWQTDGAVDGAVQRVRYTGGAVHMPKDLHVFSDGIEISFTSPLDRGLAADPDSYAIEQWNYIWSENYGSPQVKASDPSQTGHDELTVMAAEVSADGRKVFLRIDGLRPVMQMKIVLRLEAEGGEPVEQTIYNTINRPAGPYRGEAAASGAE